MLAIQSETKISLITDLSLFQEGNRYTIQYNKKYNYNFYNTKEEAMRDFIQLSNHLKNDKLKIIADKLEELIESEIEDKEK